MSTPSTFDGVIMENVALKFYTTTRFNGIVENKGTQLLTACISLCMASTNCRAFDWSSTQCATISSAAADKETICSINGFLIDSAYTHYAVLERCDVNRVVTLPLSQFTVTGGTTFTGTATTADACGFACSLTTNCAAADFNEVGMVCRHFLTLSGNLPTQACYASTTVTTSTGYTRPCINGDQTFYSAVKDGELAALNTQTSDQSPLAYFSCLASCSTSSTCLGFKYDTTGEIVDTSISTRCTLYQKGTTTELIVCGAPVATDNIFTVVRNVCQAIGSMTTQETSTKRAESTADIATGSSTTQEASTNIDVTTDDPAIQDTTAQEASTKMDVSTDDIATGSSTTQEASTNIDVTTDDAVHLKLSTWIIIMVTVACVTIIPSVVATIVFIKKQLARAADLKQQQQPLQPRCLYWNYPASQLHNPRSQYLNFQPHSLAQKFPGMQQPRTAQQPNFRYPLAVPRNTTFGSYPPSVQSYYQQFRQY